MHIVNLSIPNIEQQCTETLYCIVADAAGCFFGHGCILAMSRWLAGELMDGCGVFCELMHGCGCVNLDGCGVFCELMDGCELMDASSVNFCKV